MKQEEIDPRLQSAVDQAVEEVLPAIGVEAGTISEDFDKQPDAAALLIIGGLEKNIGGTRQTSGKSWLTAGEVAELAEVSAKTVVRWANVGKLPVMRTLGGHRRFNADAVKDILREHGFNV